ncbi:fused DSP-PTPase phosphatase/NAD kinase-like protein [Saccharospirillum mangrovi]|uniref:fused DSP-PTPase phosphatase/NAD kinase-like protein n=1 Tax=Saccharospirillum mangrovi TaxID=2161747 RepID=UPI000D33FCFA|nr:tyrosine-protein phosphatase [Saccharospirillum mangrovi]
MPDSPLGSGYKAWRKGWRDHFDRPSVRLAAWLQALFVDHGLVRPLWNRPEQFAIDAWRGNQPSPRQIRALAKRGIKTIINLRGSGNHGAWLYEQEACRQSGVELVDFRMSSRGAPKAEVILRLAEIIQQVDHPVMFHCKSGADRSGFVAGLYLLISGQGDVAAAKKQLSWRYLHFKGAKTGMLYEFFCEYERYSAQTPLAFMDWVVEVYDAKVLKRNFKPQGFSSWFVDKVLRRE